MIDERQLRCRRVPGIHIRAAVLAGVLPALLFAAGCAVPNPGPNADAAAAQQPADVPLATKPTAGQEVGALVDNQVVVSFAPGGATLSAGQDRNLDLASRLFRDANPALMFVTGHSDAVGDEYANLVLSARRAEVVKRALVARGIPPDRLLLQALGTSDPISAAAPTDPPNRRVVVTWRLL